MRRCGLLLVVLGMVSCQTKDPAARSDTKALTASTELKGYGSAAAPTHTKAGRYEGWLVTAQERFPVTFDLLATQTPSVYQGILSVHWGAGEEIGFYFDRVVAPRPGELTVENGFLTLSNLRIMDGQFTGKVATGGEARAADLFLAKREGREKAEPFLPPDVLSRPVGTQLAGSYAGTCEDKPAVLQIETFPWRRANAQAKDWFDHLQVRGRLGKPDDLMCERDALCIQRNFIGARFWALDGKLELKGRGDTLACLKVGSELVCEGCRLQKQESPQLTQRTSWPSYAVVLDTVGDDRLPQTAVEASGQYFGYLHHETRDTYQLISVSVEAQMEEGELTVSTAVTGYLGEGDSTEFSVFRFEPASVPDRGLLTLKGAADPILRIAHWTGGIVRGYWFSKTHGRVGEFQLVRDGVPQLAEGLRLEKPLSGTFRADNTEFAILASPELAEAESAVFPLRVFGNAVESNEESRRRRIEEVRYDIYNGRIGLVFDDGRLVTGTRSEKGFDLIWPPGPRFGRKVTPWTPQTFVPSSDAKPQARR